MSDIHVFEQAGLGLAPFRVVGFSVETYQACHGAPIQVGGSCDYCGTGIMNIYHILSADGHRSKVGCDCVQKTEDKGMIRKVKQMETARKREARKAREKVRIANLGGLLTNQSVQEDMASRPHPMAWRAEEGDTEYDWAEWTMLNAGNAGKIKLARHVEKIAKRLGIGTMQPIYNWGRDHHSHVDVAYRAGLRWQPWHEG